ncbi:MAG: trigger factor [Rhodospirillales bacterium]|nr:trigger factor [Alphaproteobacteria bacterium]USO03366.1 MAG: trigger factor [Rhodospirillales bacterium]
MQVKEIKSEGLSHELEVTVPANEIEKHMEARLKEVGKTVRLPGFRPGKAPMTILKKRYGRAVMGEVLEKAVNESSARALKDKDIKPAMQPKIEVKEFDEGKDLTFKIEVDTLPEFKVMDLKGLKLEKPVAKVDKKAVDESLQRIADQNPSSKPIEGNRATKKGDILVIDFHGRTRDDGVEHEGMHAHGHKLELGSGQFIPGFEDQLIGKKAGETVEVNVTFPKEYGAKELAGRDAVFDVKIEEIHEKAKGEINDDFAKSLGLEDEKALRAAVEEQMGREYASLSRMKLKRALLDVLDEKHVFDLPKGMLEAEYELILKQIESERQMSEDEDKSVSDEEKAELREIAARRVRLGLVLSDVGNKNKITVTDQELQQAVIAEARKYPGQEKIVFEYYQKNPQMLESLRAPLFEDKVVDHVFSLADITEKEVSVEELTAEEDEEETPKPEKKAAAKKKSSDKKPATKKAAKKSA